MGCPRGRQNEMSHERPVGIEGLLSVTSQKSSGSVGNAKDGFEERWAHDMFVPPSWIVQQRRVVLLPYKGD
jgi:hypothetical protein